jgi:4-diphosphocytidyl-2-C-methyl-D-erythritol kinase
VGAVRLCLRAFAKVNYALEVRGLREDSYHELSTVMQSISLADEVEIEHSREGFELLVEPEGVELGSTERNTIFRAWALLGELCGRELPVRVRLRKEIPSGAGLGGASADAAAALVGLDQLFGLGLGTLDLSVIGARIGADVPFCLAGGTALAEGIGERLAALPAPPDHHLLIAKPEAGASTTEIYRSYDESFGKRGDFVTPVLAALETGDLSALARSLGNDLDPVTSRLIPEVRALKQELESLGAIGAAMSGSGSSVFGVFESGGAAWEAAERVKAPFVDVCRPVGRGVEIL